MKDQKFFTYIVLCADNTFYTGSTNNLEQRIGEHNGNFPKKGAAYTSGRRPVVLKYSESFLTRGEALKREFALKKLTRKQKEIICRI